MLIYMEYNLLDMPSFKEFLQNCEAKEADELNIFNKRVDDGMKLTDNCYPPKSRFKKLSAPVGSVGAGSNIFGVIPFCGSTVVKLSPRNNRKAFDVFHKGAFGFTSHDIEGLLDMAKETGRVQFTLSTRPTEYANLDFLEQVFYELQPPVSVWDPQAFVGDKYKQYGIEFGTLAAFGYTDYVNRLTSSEDVGSGYRNEWIINHLDRYAVLKAMGYGELADEIGYWMIINPRIAHEYLTVFGTLLSIPGSTRFEMINFLGKEVLDKVADIGRPYGFKSNEYLTYDIGKLLLEKAVLRPETLDGCKLVTQLYDDHDMYKVLGALNTSIKEKTISSTNITELKETFDSVWDEANRVNGIAKYVKHGVALTVGVVGECLSGIPGAGIIGILPEIIDDYGSTNEPFSEMIAKKITNPNLVIIHDFKKEHHLEK